MSLLDAEVPPESSEIKWSDLQLKIFAEIKGREENLLINAVAGSAKTTTIIEGAKYAKGSSVFLAFNKAIADELNSRLSAGTAKTFNALGHQLWAANRPASILDRSKIWKLMKGYNIPEPDQSDLAKLIGLIKNAGGVDIEDSIWTYQDFIGDLINDFDLDLPLSEEFIETVMDIYKDSLRDINTFDFNDQLLVPVLENWEFPQWDNIFVDEAQDLSSIQHEMIRRIHGRTIAVGDPYQAIYGFRGALNNSIDILKNEFKMTELPLSISYRCARSIVAEAQVFCPYIQAAPWALEGSVVEIEALPMAFNDSMVVCRYNAPLFKLILRQIRQQKPCRVLSNFLESIQGFIRKFRCQKTSELQVKLDRWLEREGERARRNAQFRRLDQLKDKHATLSLLCHNYSSVHQILELLEKLSTGTSGPTFSTIHKAKGLEHHTVFYVNPDLQCSDGQEPNLAYVAITRAKENLVYFTDRGY